MIATQNFSRYRCFLRIGLALIIGWSVDLKPLFGQSAVPVPPDIISWWKGESNVVDTIGGVNGYETNGAGYGPGEVGTGFSLDGVDDRVLAPNSPAVNFGPNQDFSIETWIQAFPTPGNYLGFTAIFDKTLTPDASSAVGWMLFMQNGYLGFLMSAAPMSVGGSSWWMAFQPNLQDGKFHHVAVTIERTIATGGKMYIDGNLVSTFDPRQESGDLSNTEPLHIGNHANPNLNCFFKGIIDEVSLYNRALTPAEISAIYQAGSAGKAGPVEPAPIPNGLVGWWKGESNVVDVVSGVSGYETNGASYGPGEVGTGFRLDGITSRVVIPDSPALHFGTNQDFSIETWIQAFPTPGNYYGIAVIADKAYTPDYVSTVGWVFYIDYGLLGFNMSQAPLSPFNYSFWSASGPDLQDGKFHHVAVAVERASTTGGKMYIDGNVVLTFDPTPQSGDLSNNGPLRLGNHANTNLNCFFKGTIDEVSIYNRALTAAEFKAIFAAGAAGKANPVIDDGIPAEWREKYFGPNYALNPQAAATADPDQDGANNYQEYLAGTDPLNAKSVFRTPTYVSTYAGSVPGGVDGYVTNATFFTPDSLGIDSLGRYWVTESYIIGWEPGQDGGNRVRMITNNTVLTIAGSDEPGLVEGPGLTARFRGPTSPAFDSLGNVFVCDRGNHRIRKISPDGYVSTFVGSQAGFVNGTGANAQLHSPIGLVIDKFNNLYVGDFDNIRVRKVTPEGVVTTYAGTGQRGSQDGPRQSATFDSPSGLAIAGDGTIYVADWLNGLVRKIGTNGVVSTVAQGLWYAERLTVDPAGNILVARDGGRYATLITPEGQVIWSLHWGQGYQDGLVSNAKFQGMSSPLYMPDGDILVTDINNNRLRIIHQTVPPLLSLSPASGTEVPVLLRISTVVTNGVVHFTTSDSDPTVNSPLYSNAVLITSNCTVKARVFVNGYPVSDIASATYLASFPNDGISDEWRIQYFGPNSQSDPRIAATADPDNDGANNYQEFLANTDPLNPNSKPANPTLLLSFNPDGGEFTNYVQVALSTTVTNGIIKYWVDDLTRTNEVINTNTYNALIDLDVAATVSAEILINGYPVSPVYRATFQRVYAIDDGIANGWREEYFGAGYRTDPRVAADADPDGDGANNLTEYLSGTDPTDPQSVLKIAEIRMVPVVTWNSVSNKLYRVLRLDDINSDEWTLLTPLVRATNSSSTFTDYSATNSKAFYWVEPLAP